MGRSGLFRQPRKDVGSLVCEVILHDTKRILHSVLQEWSLSSLQEYQLRYEAVHYDCSTEDDLSD